MVQLEGIGLAIGPPARTCKGLFMLVDYIRKGDGDWDVLWNRYGEGREQGEGKEQHYPGRWNWARTSSTVFSLGCCG